MSLAPIVLFVYNRPQHTLKTLEALMQNELAEMSELFIFCDGPKADATKQDQERINLGGLQIYLMQLAMVNSR